MKKKLLFSICLFITSFTLFLSKVNAFECKYYIDGGSSYKPDLVLKNVSSATAYDIDVPSSINLIHEFSGSGVNYDFAAKKGRYVYFIEESPQNNDFWEKILDKKSMLMFLSLYPNQQAFEVITSTAEDEADKCPKYLEFEYYTSGANRKTIYSMVHTDDLDFDPSQPVNIDGSDDLGIIDSLKVTVTKFANAVQNFKSRTGHGYLVLEKYKDKKIDELIGQYKCLTYTSEMDIIKKTVKDKGCENNQTFNKHYEDLKELCDAFRETKSYSNVDSKAKDCSKACSNFKDDIAEMCQLEANSGCGSLGPKIIKWLYKIIKWARYIIPVVIIILVMLEYIKALASEDEKAMKDATSHMFTRLIVAAIIFILPFILDFILNLFNISELDINNLFCQK